MVVRDPHSTTLVSVERAAWTNERLDDLAEAMRSGFERVDRDFRDQRGEIAGLRTEMREELGSVRGEIGSVRGEIAGLRTEMREEFGSMRGEINELRLMMFRIGGGVMVGLVGVIAAILARGV